MRMIDILCNIDCMLMCTDLGFHFAVDLLAMLLYVNSDIIGVYVLLYDNSCRCSYFCNLTIIVFITFVIVINSYQHITNVKNICFTKIKFVPL